MARGHAEIIYIFSAAMAPYALHFERGGKILDMQDIDLQKWAAYAQKARGAMRRVWAREARTLFAYERHAAMACDITFFVTEEETRRFAELAPETADGLTWIGRALTGSVFAGDRLWRLPIPVPGRTSSSPGTWIIGRRPMP